MLESTASWLSSRKFFLGVKSIVMQISFVMLILLLFSDQISRGQKSPRGQTAAGSAPCPPVEKSQASLVHLLSTVCELKGFLFLGILQRTCQDNFSSRNSPLISLLLPQTGADFAQTARTAFLKYIFLKRCIEIPKNAIYV